jgi:hypothetical protein
MLGMVESSKVGIDRRSNETTMPNRRLMARPTTAIARPAAAMPKVVALTAKLMIAGEVA